MAKKNIKNDALKFDISDSVNKIQKTAKEVTKKVTKTAEEVASDVMQEGQQFLNESFRRVQNRVEDFSLENTFDGVKKTAGEVNAYAATTAEEVVDGVYNTGLHYQVLSAKAIKGGLKLAAEQQKIVLKAMEEMKGQFETNGKRFTELFK